MDAGLKAALDYIPRWIEFQMRLREQPGCVVSVAREGRIELEVAFGAANLATGEQLTPRHRFRVASHSKTFTASAILLLRERGRLRLDDPVGRFVGGLHPAVAEATLAQLLSHGAGLPRDGSDGGGGFADRRSFLDAAELLADLALPPPIEAGLRFKYSNHGYGLLGLVVEAVTSEPYAYWVAREVVAAAGLEETAPDIELVPAGAPRARGHSGPLPLGRRVVIPADNATRAMAAATGFVSTAADLVRFFGQLAPDAPRSLLSKASRREMARRHWRDRDTSVERHYGLGVISGPPEEWEWFGHSGSFQGFITRTVVLPSRDLAVSVLTNASDGFALFWADGVMHILRTLSGGGVPSSDVADWGGRWWGLSGALDLVPVGGAKVLAAAPALLAPLLDAAELEVFDPEAGRVSRAPGLDRVGEAVRRVRGADGEVRALRIGGATLVTEAELVREMEERYGR